MSQQPQAINQFELQGCSVQTQMTSTLEHMAKEVGFTWDHVDNIINNIRAEIEEVHQVIRYENSDSVRLQDEIGDLYMAVLCLCIYLHLNPETVLKHANDKFYKRFKHMKYYMLENNIDDLKKFSMLHKLELWQKAKKAADGAAGED